MNGKQIVNFLAYISITLIAVVLLVGTILGKVINQDVLNLIMIFAQAVAYIITAVYGFVFAKSKRNIAWLIVYFVAVVLIAVLLGVNVGSIIKSLKA